MTRRPDARGWLGRLLNLPERPPTTRLSAQEVVELAAESPAVRATGRQLTVATARHSGEAVVWEVSTGGVGARWWVEVDDATGIVGAVRHAHGR